MSKIEDQLTREAATLKAERERLREEFAQARADTRAAVQAQITTIDKKLEAIQAQAKADYAIRKAKLDQAGKLVRETLAAQ